MLQKRRLFVDTSGWTSYVGDDQPLHSETVRIYREAVRRKRTLVTTGYVLTELVALLQSRSIIPRQRIFEFIDQLHASPHLSIIHIDAEHYQQAWDLLKERPDKTWSLVDASSFVVMRQLAITEALTTDHHFEQAGFKRLPAQ